MPEKSFSERVYEAVRRIPYGKVATYQQIAYMAGSPDAARAVGNALHKNPTPVVVPCHRVVNAKGRLARHFGFGGEKRQKELLEAEGVKVSDDYYVDLKAYIYTL